MPKSTHPPLPRAAAIALLDGAELDALHTRYSARGEGGDWTDSAEIRDFALVQWEIERRARGIPPARHLTCSCCGARTVGRPWRERDAGFGLCGPCVPYVSRKGTNNPLPPDEVRRCYGDACLHYFPVDQ